MISFIYPNNENVLIWYLHLEEMEKWELTKFDGINVYQAIKENVHYNVYLTISTGYNLYLNSREHTLYVSDYEQGYRINNDDNFWAILEEIQKETPTN